VIFRSAVHRIGLTTNWWWLLAGSLGSCLAVTHCMQDRLFSVPNAAATEPQGHDIAALSALFVWLISDDRKYCWMIYYERKILLNDW